MRLASSTAAPRQAVLLAALLAHVAVANACGGGDDSGWGRALGGGGGRRTIGVVLPTRGTPFYQELEAGLREAAKRAKYELVVTAGDMSNPAAAAAAQVGQVDGLLRRRVDAVVIAPIDSLAVVPAVERANAARVPVFTVGLHPHGGRIVSHVQADHVGTGQLAAEYLTSFLSEKGNVAVVSRAGIAALAERDQGFRDALRTAHRVVTVVDSVASGGGRAAVEAAVEAMLKAHREIDAIFSVDDAGALGAYDAAMARYRADLFIVGCDASPETLQLIQTEGPLKASLVQQPRQMGERLIQLAARHFADEPVAPRVLVPVRLVNIDSLRPAGKPTAGRSR